MKRASPIRRAFDQAAGPTLELCPICCGPNRCNAELPSLVLQEDEPIPSCQACGDAVFQDGKSAVVVGLDGVRNPIVIVRLIPSDE